MKKITYVLILISVCFIGTHAFSGGNSSGGGDIIAWQFNDVAKLELEALTQLKDISPKDLPTEIDVDKLRNAVENTQIVAKERLYVDKDGDGKEEEVDALNYPDEMRIEVNKSRWELLPSWEMAMLVLVFHEYLGIMRVDDNNYRLSSQIYDLITLSKNKKYDQDQKKLVNRLGGMEIKSENIPGASWGIQFLKVDDNNFSTCLLHYKSAFFDRKELWWTHFRRFPFFGYSPKDQSFYAIIAFYNRNLEGVGGETIRPFSNDGQGIFVLVHLTSDEKIILKCYAGKPSEKSGYVVIDWDNVILKTDITEHLKPYVWKNPPTRYAEVE